MNSKQLDYQFYSNNENQIKIYKKKLLLVVIFVSIILIFIMLERLFYGLILQKENSMISLVQDKLNLQQIINKDNNYIRKFNSNFIFDSFCHLNTFKYSFLLFTVYIAIFFICIDPEIAIKVGYLTLYMYYCIICLQLIYEGPRPFWNSNNNKENINKEQKNIFVNTITTPVCLRSFGHPSKYIFISMFIGFYSIYCYEQKKREENKDYSLKKLKLLLGCVFLILVFQNFQLVKTTQQTWAQESFIFQFYTLQQFFRIKIQIIQSLNHLFNKGLPKNIFSIGFQWQLYQLFLQL
ncbi:hypothetical protein IMG5_196050 [Ichthyophthirius multifiliis]|uniref:Transmembrane protein n=1 Tax=Ichthyophthirius multifiliis TaxID=5932 RepID=G0R521_ICHMU|nr:hypothetical protein IMG5_196050 [Ichthyophthirius multifiliis]EGR27423.1 hypothetical protein IMG5_196050 [Ichthyophthirius multifiliis]|eukprot:XP_004024333.1 hypothetical protein IMG5_196050 [Ichthyophthirius multifiliis]